MFHLIFVILAVTPLANCLIGTMKNVTVTGRLECYRSPVSAKVELWEDDTFNYDDLLNTTVSDAQGRFRIYGQAREVRNIEPYLLIHHNCDGVAQNPNCMIIDRYNVPKKHVGKTFYMPTINLTGGTNKRKRKCN